MSLKALAEAVFHRGCCSFKSCLQSTIDEVGSHAVRQSNNAEIQVNHDMLNVI